jgi:hypothetical protein
VQASLDRPFRGDPHGEFDFARQFHELKLAKAPFGLRQLALTPRCAIGAGNRAEDIRTEKTKTGE